MRNLRWMACALFCAVTSVCLAQAPKKGNSPVTKQPYGTMKDGTPIELYTLTSSSGMEARIITYGGIVVSLTAPDRGGKQGDIVLGMNDLAGYIDQKPPFF